MPPLRVRPTHPRYPRQPRILPSRYATANDHDGPVVGLSGRQTQQGGLLYTAAADQKCSTIRWWDLDSLQTIKVRRASRGRLRAQAEVYRDCYLG